MPRYVIEKRLGAGGMAEVFQARQLGAEGFSRRVALKRVLPNWSSDENFARMFISEARVVSSLSHPNIVSVLDFDRDEAGSLYLTMELVAGCDLSRLRDKLSAAGEMLPVGLAVFVCGEILRALEYAHRADLDGKWLGIVHRDVSPHNVLVGRNGSVKLTDFGIAKATAASTHSGMVRGKLAYMSPEQANGQPLDGRSDLFAVGVMLYELLAGARPFDGETESQTLANVILCRYAPLGERAPWVPGDVQQVVARLLEAAPEGRHATAHEALRALVACRCYVPDGTSELAALVERILGPPPPVVPSDVYVGEVRGTSDATRTRTPSGGGRRARWLPWLGGAGALAAGIVVAVWLAPRLVQRAPVAAAPVAPPPPAPVVAAPVDAPPPPPDAAAPVPDAAAPAPRPRARRQRPEWEIPTDRKGREVIVPSR